MSTVRRAMAGGSRCSVMIERSAVAITPPLKLPIGVVIPRGPSNKSSPEGGRLLMIEKASPLARSSATADMAREVSLLSSSTNVPSTSVITAEHLNGSARVPLMTISYRHRRRCCASVDHLAPEVHPLRRALSFPQDRSEDLLRRPWPRRRAPAARHAKRAPPY